MLNVKQKNDGMDQNTLHCFHDKYGEMWLEIKKLKQIKHNAVILHPYHVTLLSKTCQNVLFVVGFP